ncbi:DASH family cryptochrome [Cobetia marina]|uniref:DASH family cryptochrome n=1 Tax=Cobetia marina TaxID=28258 RepID=UPI003A91B744
MTSTDTWLVWLDDDLRLDDNPLWQAALEEHPAHLLVVYILPETTFQPIGIVSPDAARLQPLSVARQRFLLESLESLQAGLQALGSDLLILQGDAAHLIPELARQHACRGVIARHATGLVERRQQQAVAASCRLRQVNSGLLLDEDDLPFTLSELPETFSAFRRKLEKAYPDIQAMPAPVAAPCALPSWPAQAPRGVQGNARRLNAARDWQSDPRGDHAFLGGEPAALQRLEHYLSPEHAGQYKTTRNRLSGADFSTRFSAWLALGCLSPRRILDRLHTFQKTLPELCETPQAAFKDSDWIRVELLWREYFHWDTRQLGRQVFLAGRPGTDSLRHEACAAIPDALARWQAGMTGVPWVDAGMRELAATGWLSNRMRQNVASYLIKDLGVDWRLGAAWFEHQLLDHDVASNWGNWRYLAGVGRDPRADRHFNMMKQARQHDPLGHHVTRWIPELETLPAGMQRHAPWIAWSFRVTPGASGGINGTTQSGYPRQPLHLVDAWQPHLSDVTPTRVKPWLSGSFERG